jgi:hypothetical protein
MALWPTLDMPGGSAELAVDSAAAALQPYFVETHAGSAAVLFAEPPSPVGDAQQARPE